MKSEAAESPHELALKHCKPCVTGFEALKAQAEAGEDGGLFALAVKQTEEAQRALGQVAQPGPGPLSGLSPDGDLRVEETVSPPKQAERVSLSRAARLRRPQAVDSAIQGATMQATRVVPSDSPPEAASATEPESTSRQVSGIEAANAIPAPSVSGGGAEEVAPAASGAKRRPTQVPRILRWSSRAGGQQPRW